MEPRAGVRAIQNRTSSTFGGPSVAAHPEEKQTETTRSPEATLESADLHELAWATEPKLMQKTEIIRKEEIRRITVPLYRPYHP
ncbi:MAG: hypothetical protein AB7F43_13630 [Bacteriovoracia bacterium]